MIVKQIWDGAIDPFIGMISDNISTRFGRRKPFMYTFIIPAAAIWIAMWASPTIILGKKIRWVYYCGIMLLFSSFDSLVMVPYQSMIPDMANGYHERTFVVLFTQMFLFIGTGCASVIWSYLIEYFPVEDLPEEQGMPHDYRKGYLIAACVMVVPVVIVYYISAFVAKERPTDSEEYVEELVTFADDNFNAFDESSPLISKKSSKGKCAKLGSILRKLIVDVKEVILYLPFLSMLGLAITTLVATSFFSSNFVLWIKYTFEHEELSGLSFVVLQVSSTL